MLRIVPVLLILGCQYSVEALATEPIRAPNFVIFLVDDLGWTDLGCFGSKFYETPSIDRLAGQSLMLTNAYAAAPVCSPTRASIQTGKYPARLATTEWFGGLQPQEALGKEFANQFSHRPLLPAEYRDHLPLEETTLAEALHAAGYSTFFAGKWHLGGEGFLPELQGYDINLGGCELGWPVGGYFSPYSNPKLPDGPIGEHLPDRLASESVKFLHGVGKQPFLLFLSFYSVHVPLEGRESLIERYRQKAQTLPQEVPHFVPEGSTKSRVVQDEPVYASMVEDMDAAVGKVLSALDEQGLGQNTIVFFLSDNGGLTSTAENSPTSNLPLRAGKGWLYEGGIRIPWLMKVPGMPTAGKSTDELAITNDIYPTMLELASLPARPEQHQDGVSLAGVIRGEAAPDRTTLYWHYPHYSNQGGPPGSAIRAGDWKLIEWLEDKRLELFNLKSDIGERTNLADKLPEKAKELHEMLLQWRKSVDAPLPTPNPSYRRATGP